MNKVYTFGYGRTKIESLVAYADWLDAVVVDVRMNASSRLPDWNKGKMSAALGKRYVHIREFGNANYKSGGPIVLSDPATGCAKILKVLEKHSVILLCACESVAHCHRNTVSELLLERYGLEPTHLSKKDLVIPKSRFIQIGLL